MINLKVRCYILNNMRNIIIIGLINVTIVLIMVIWILWASLFSYTTALWGVLFSIMLIFVTIITIYFYLECNNEKCNCNPFAYNDDPINISSILTPRYNLDNYDIDEIIETPRRYFGSNIHKVVILTPRNLKKTNQIKPLTPRNFKKTSQPESLNNSDETNIIKDEKKKKFKVSVPRLNVSHIKR